MAYFLKEYFDEMKDYFHLNIATFIENYTDDKGFFELPPFHGCGLKNRNGSLKLVDYRNDDQCLCPVWTDDNCKIKYGLYPMTRYMTQGRYRYLYKDKESSIWNYKTKNMLIY